MNESLEGWTEYRKLILAELERLSASIHDTNRKIDEFRSDDIAQIKVEIAMLKVKAGAWGALAGLLPTLAALLIWLVTKKG
jgi:hypothetical protein